MPHAEASRDTVVSLLEAAAARLRDRGWTRGKFGPPEGPNCILGALRYEAADALRYEVEAGQAEYVACWRALGGFLRGEHPAMWNDRTCPGAAAAVDALLGAAKEVAGASV